MPQKKFYTLHVNTLKRKKCSCYKHWLNVFKLILIFGNTDWLIRSVHHAASLTRAKKTQSKNNIQQPNPTQAPHAKLPLVTLDWLVYKITDCSGEICSIIISQFNIKHTGWRRSLNLQQTKAKIYAPRDR